MIWLFFRTQREGGVSTVASTYVLIKNQNKSYPRVSSKFSLICCPDTFFRYEAEDGNSIVSTVITTLEQYVAIVDIPLICYW